MICDKCNQEISFAVFEGLILRPIEQLGKSFNEIRIPYGWRLPTLTEGIKLVNNPKFVDWSGFSDGYHDFYIEQPFEKNKGKYMAWLGCDNNYFILSTLSDLDDNIADRGVLLIKEDKEE